MLQSGYQPKRSWTVLIVIVTGDDRLVKPFSTHPDSDLSWMGAINQASDRLKAEIGPRTTALVVEVIVVRHTYEDQLDIAAFEARVKAGLQRG